MAEQTAQSSFDQQNVSGDQSMKPLIQGPNIAGMGGGNPLANTFLQQLGPSMLGAIGYATRNPVMQEQANKTQQLVDTMQMQMPVQQAHSAINDAIAKNDYGRAMQIYHQGMAAGFGVLDPSWVRYGDVVAKGARQQAINNADLAGMGMLTDQSNPTSPSGTPVTQTEPAAQGTPAPQPQQQSAPPVNAQDAYNRTYAQKIMAGRTFEEAEKAGKQAYDMAVGHKKTVDLGPGRGLGLLNEDNGQITPLPNTIKRPEATFTTNTQTGGARVGEDMNQLKLDAESENDVIRARATNRIKYLEEKGREITEGKPSAEQIPILKAMGRTDFVGMGPAEAVKFQQMEDSRKFNLFQKESATRIAETRAAVSQDSIVQHQPALAGGLVANSKDGTFEPADRVTMGEARDPKWQKGHVLIPRAQADVIHELLVARDVMDRIQPAIDSAAAENAQMPIGQAVTNKVKGLAGYQSPDVFFKTMNVPIVAINRRLSNRMNQKETELLSEALQPNLNAQTGRVRDQMNQARDILNDFLAQSAGTTRPKIYNPRPGYDSVWLQGKQYFQSQTNPGERREPW